MNRLMRRMRRFGKGARRKGSVGSTELDKSQESVVDAKAPQDVTSVRAKSEGHGKKTADKWNQ